LLFTELEWGDVGFMTTSPAPVGALKIKDAARYLGGVSPITVRRLIRRGLLKPNRALRHVLIPVAELDRFIALGGCE
jgi:excisionase family DNA binding protein